MFGFSSWGEGAAFVSVIIAIMGGIGWLLYHSYHKDVVRRLDKIEDWQTFMEKEYLPENFARKDISEMQYRQTQLSNERVEKLLSDTKAEFKTSLHALRQDILIFARKTIPQSNGND